jgi:hypothetical protein
MERKPPAELPYSSLQAVDFQYANLQAADLYEANLQDAYLHDANLQDAKLWKANLRGANLADSNMRDANIREANFDERTILPDATPISPDGVPLFHYKGEDPDATYTRDSFWTPNTDMTRYTNSNHPDFWEPDWVKRKRKQDEG